MILANYASMCDNKWMCKTLEQVRQAIERSGLSRYRIAQETGISQSQLSRLMSGDAGLSFPKLEMLLDYLGYKITVKKKRKGK